MSSPLEKKRPVPVVIKPSACCWSTMSNAAWNSVKNCGFMRLSWLCIVKRKIPSATLLSEITCPSIERSALRR